MVTGELKNKIDKIWEVFWTGGVTNPLSVIEQITYLFLSGPRRARHQTGKGSSNPQTRYQSVLFPRS